MAFPPYEVIVREVNEILKKYKGEKLTLRQIYYQLIVRKVFENIPQNYKYLSHTLVKAREAGDVDDSRIEDRGRKVMGGDHSLRQPEEFYQSHENAFRRCWNNYSRPYWLDQPDYVEVWVEKDSLASIVSVPASQFNVMTCVGKGYSSYSYVNEAAKRIMRMCKAGGEVDRCPKILYFGDHDPSGHDMVRDLEARLKRYGLETDVDDYQVVEKIAITKDQIKEYKLPTDPISLKKKKDDKRSKKFISEFGNRVVELDALDPDVLKQMVQSAIEAHIDPEIWNKHADESERERNEIREKIEEHFGRR
jgi:hypothetical protein